MAKNRKNQGGEFRAGPVVRAALLCLFLGGSAIGYVWQTQQVAKLGVERRQKENALSRIESENALKRHQFDLQLQPRALEDRVRTLRLPIGPHQPGQVIHVSEPAGGSITPARVNDGLASTEAKPSL